MIREVTVKEYPFEDRVSIKGNRFWVNLKFSSHSWNQPCWRNMSPEDAIELGKDLLVAGLRAKAETETWEASLTGSD